MRKLLIKIIPAVLCIALLLSLVTVLFGCDKEPEEKEEPKRAIIVMHGILGGALWNTDTDTNCWDPLHCDINLADFFTTPFKTIADGLNQEVNLGTNVVKFVTNLIDMKKGTMLERIQLDDNGVPLYDTVVPANWDMDNRFRYGALNAYKNLWTVMNNRYGDYMDVVVFQYDWRLSAEKGAAALESFIAEKGYDEVILAPHSMGNLVISQYLAKASNREKTLGYLAYAPPFYGSFMAIDMLENPDKLTAGLADLDLSELPTILRSLINSKLNDIYELYEKCKKSILFRMPGLVELLPTIEMVDTLNMYYGDEFVDPLDGSEIKTNEALCRFYLSRSWAKYEDENGEEQTRTFAANLINIFNHQNVTVDGEVYHSSSLVKTHYFIGTGMPTNKSCTFDSNDGYSSSTELQYYSDGTVENASSLPLSKLKSLNMTYEDVCRDIDEAVKNNKDFIAYDNVSIFMNSDHFDCGIGFDENMINRTYEFIDSILPEKLTNQIKADAE